MRDVRWSQVTLRLSRGGVGHHAKSLSVHLKQVDPDLEGLGKSLLIVEMWMSG